MKQVYRMTLRIGEFNDMLLQSFEETVLKDPSDAIVTEINSRWRIRNQHLELIHPNGFERHPSALLEAFVLLAQNPRVEGFAHRPRVRCTRLDISSMMRFEMIWSTSATLWSSCVTPKNCPKY